MRISGGIHRSRVLTAPRGANTRPTSDRVREALFSILESRAAIANARVIDLYAGTGALGLEALSRGASFVTFVESDRRALEALARNVDALRERPRARILPVPVTRAVSTLVGDAATLVLCDPPYAEVASGKIVTLLEAVAKSAAEGATIVLEHATRDQAQVSALTGGDSVTTLRDAESRAYGDTSLTFFRIYSGTSR
jgi:16S rRNA (guanine966-N2)-methyltransferase